jgi:uncharacterized membrane-anchored protein YitT (DUF2179 family)
MNKKKIFKIIYEGLILILGNALMAFSYRVLIIEANIMTGGMGGIALIFDKVFHIDISFVIAILAWILFFIGWFFFGKKFALHTLVATLFYPIFVFLFGYIDFSPILHQNIGSDYGLSLIYVIVAAIIQGFGLGIVFRIGGSTGGVDILCLLISRKTKWKLDTVVFLVDGVIIALGLFSFTWVEIFLGIFCAWLASKVIDFVLLSGTGSIIITIISKENDSINDYIQHQLERGATFIKGIGGYTGEDRMILQVVVSKYEYHRLLAFINSKDKNAFVTSVSAREIYGNGFKEYMK